MKKSSRLLLLVAIMAAAVYFLIPTFVWYAQFSDDDRVEAGLSGVKLKTAVQEKVSKALDEYNEDADEIRLILVKELKKDVKDYNSIAKKKIKLDSNATKNEIEAVLAKLRIEKEDFYNKALERYFEETFAKKRKVRSKIIKLGLDLQGGAYAVVSANFDHPSVEGKFTKDKEKADALDNAALMIENRINKFGVSETTIQKMKEQNKIVINLPGVNN